MPILFRYFFFVVCALLLLAAAAAHAGATFPTPVAPQLDADERQQLADGEILAEAVRDDLIRMTVIAVIDAPPSEVWDIVRDFSTSEEWVPDMDESTAVERSEGRMIADAKTSMPFPLRDRSYRLDIREVPMSADDVHASHWVSVEGHGNINEMRGYWWIGPWEDTGRTLAVQVTWADFGVPVPGGLVRRGAENQLPATMEALRERHESIY